MSYTRSGEVLAECGAAYTKAYKLYRAAGDDKWVAKTVSRLAQAYLERLVSPVLLLHLPIERLTQLTAAPLPGRLTHLTLEEVEAPAALALDLSAEIPAPFLSLRAQLNVAELRALRNERTSSAALVRDCVDTLMGLFVEPSTNVPVLRHAPPAFLRKLLALFQRAARLVLCLGGDLAAQSSGLLDAMLQLEADLACARRRSVREGSVQPSTGLGRQKFRGAAGLAAPAKANQPALRADFPSALPLRDTIRLPRGAPSPIAMGAGGVATLNVPASSPSPRGASPTSKAREALEGERAASNAINEAAEQVWSVLLQLKPLAANYVSGRITQEEALQQGRKAVQSVTRTLQALRVQCASLRRVHSSGQNSPRSRYVPPAISTRVVLCRRCVDHIYVRSNLSFATVVSAAVRTPLASRSSSARMAAPSVACSTCCNSTSTSYSTRLPPHRCAPCALAARSTCSTRHRAAWAPHR